MPFKRGAHYRIQIRHLPGYGPFPETSTYVSSKAVAQQMETMVRRIAEKGLQESSWYELLDALRGGRRGQPGELTLPDLLRAYNENRLDELRISFKDPSLRDAISDYLTVGVDYETENGLKILEEMAQREFGPKPRISILRSGKNITKLCARAEREGGRSRKKNDAGEVGWFDDSPLSRNTVYRGMRNAISKLCIFHFGPAARDQIFSAVQYSAVDDTREIFLDATQLEKLLRACPSWFRPFVMTAALTGADRKPLLRLRVRDVDVVHRVDLGLKIATLYIPDSKNDSRPRSVTMAGPAAESIEKLVQGRESDERVFRGWFTSAGRRVRLTKDRVRQAWEAAREKAGFTRDKGWHDDLRFKDLRHTAGVAFEQVGMGTTKIGAGLGHKRRETSLRYTKRQVQLDAQDAIKVARHLGILHDLIAPKAKEQ